MDGSLEEWKFIPCEVWKDGWIEGWKGGSSFVRNLRIEWPFPASVLGLRRHKGADLRKNSRDLLKVSGMSGWNSHFLYIPGFSGI